MQSALGHIRRRPPACVVGLWTGETSRTAAIRAAEEIAEAKWGTALVQGIAHDIKTVTVWQAEQVSPAKWEARGQAHHLLPVSLLLVLAISCPLTVSQMFGDGAGQLPGVTPVEHPATRRPEYTGTGLREETFAGVCACCRATHTHLHCLRALHRTHGPHPHVAAPRAKRCTHG